MMNFQAEESGKVLAELNARLDALERLVEELLHVYAAKKGALK